MAEVKANVKVPEFLREPIEAAQARLEVFEEEAQKVLKDLVQKGRESRKELKGLVTRISGDGHLKTRFDRLRAQGIEELRGRAESFRVEALERLEELQAKAVAFLGAATREQVVELSKELDRLSRRLEKTERKPAKKAKAVKRASRAAAEG
ncbi:hypothetical protein [Anaeromyxobacter paludicola]|uniref:Phasin family protein n=1 Tax=Anaeromyxobacter paludicola TaxID=2918171 RepID=A0ABN6N7T9_9BACT|nr:hypothetical protein [Anaeromyxobacter paludicola]BDG08055.1 hypothetical protein AMPC_11680 [Anaeromyxobacter paludicola]